MSNICRLCLRNEEHIPKHNIFDMALCDKLYWIFGVEVEVADPFSKSICQKCLNIMNYVKKLKKFFQMNQYLLQEKKCPLDFDIEFVNLTLDVGTQTEFYPPKHTNNIEVSSSVSLTKRVNVMSQKYSCYVECIKKGKKRGRKPKSVVGKSPNTWVPIPLQLFKMHFSPRIVLPRLETVCHSLGYEHVEPLVYRNVGKAPIIIKTEKEDYSYTNSGQQVNTALERLYQYGTVTNYKSIGINTELILGGSYIKTSDKIIRNRVKEGPSTPPVILRSIGTLTDPPNPPVILRSTGTLTDPPNPPVILRSTGTLTDPSNPNYISVPINIFDKFGVPFVCVEKLKLTNDPNPDTNAPGTSDSNKKLKKNKPNYFDYYYRMPTSALSELITERNEAVSGQKKAIQEEKSFFKIDDVFHAEMCDLCHQVFKSKERLRIHQDIQHNNSPNSRINMDSNRATTKISKFRRLITSDHKQCDIPEISNYQLTSEEAAPTTMEVIEGEYLDTSDEEVDVTTVNRAHCLPMFVPEVVLFCDKGDTVRESNPVNKPTFSIEPTVSINKVKDSNVLKKPVSKKKVSDSNVLKVSTSLMKYVIQDHNYVKSKQKLNNVPNKRHVNSTSEKLNSDVNNRNSDLTRCDMEVDKSPFETNSSGESDSVDLKKKKLFKINNMKYEIKVWENIQNILMEQYTQGTEDLEQNYMVIKQKLDGHVSIKQEPVDPT